MNSKKFVTFCCIIFLACVIDWIVFCSTSRPELVTSYLPPALASKINTKGKQLSINCCHQFINTYCSLSRLRHLCG